MASIALVPSAPVLVPEFAGAAAIEVAAFHDAALAAAASLPDRWIAIGGGPADAVIDAQAQGTFAGYGRDIRVSLSAEGARAPLTEMPLCALITAWLRGCANPGARAEVRVYAATHDVQTALSFGRTLRAEIDACDEEIGVLVVADGANTITPAAPGGYDPEAELVQTALDDALATVDLGVLSTLPAGIVGRVTYQVLAGLAADSTQSAREIIRGAPYGVGYFVGVWTPQSMVST